MDRNPIASGRSSLDLVDLELLFRELGLKADSNILDLACGSGRYSIELSKRTGPNGMVHAVDLWEDGIASLQQAISDNQIHNIRTRVADVSKHIPVDDHSIDICLMATVLHDLIEDKTDVGTLSEVKRILKREGKLAIIEFKKINGPPGPPKAIRLSPEDLVRYLRSYSFQPVKTVELGVSTYLSIFITSE